MEKYYIPWEKSSNGGMTILADSYEEAVKKMQEEEKKREDNPPGLFPLSELE